MSNIADMLSAALAPEQRELLRRAAVESARRGVRLYLVGGAVRDALLGRPVVDLDVTAVSGGPRFGFALADSLGGQVLASSQFGTHEVRANGVAFDLVMARAESYAHPGALPTVRPGSISEDLARRDFSINAMAVELRNNAWGEMLDPCGGVSDLQAGLIRTLHDASFRDDATRIVRATRYAGRYGFQLEEDTARVLARDLRHLDTISGDRLRHELEKVFDEPSAARVLRLLRDAGALRAIHPSLNPDDTTLALIDEAAGGGPDTRPVLLSLLVSSLPAEAAPTLVRRLNLGTDWTRVVRDTIALRDVMGRLRRSGLRPSEADGLLSAYDEHALRGCALAAGDQAAAWVRHYLDELRHVRPLLDGNDLLALGVKRGPRMGELLRALRRARLDDELGTREDEVVYVRERLGADGDRG